MIIKEEELEEDDQLHLCDPCERSKPLRHTRKKATLRNLKVFDEVHIDVVMLTPQGIRKKKYATVFTEKVSLVKWAYFHESKNGAYDAVIKYQKMVKTQFGSTVKKWRMDGGKEYSPTKLTVLAEDLGQVVELTTPYNPEQDGTSERSIGILCERTRTAIIDLNIPAFLWPLILETVVMISNRTATSLHEKTPFQALMDELFPEQDNVPSVAHFRVLGCKTYVQIPKEKRVTSEKVKERAEVGILVGYEGTHIFKVYVPSRRGPLENRIVRSSNVRFDEGGLITKPLPSEQEDGNRGDEVENQDRQAEDLIHNHIPDALNQNRQKATEFQRAMIPQEETSQIANEQEAEDVFEDLANHPEISSEIDEDETELFPEVTEPHVKDVQDVQDT